MKKIIFTSVTLLSVILLGACSNGSGQTTKETLKKQETHQKKDKEFVSKSLFIGDSITEGFVLNELVPKDNAIAGAGATAGFTIESLKKSPNKEFERIFIMLGSDDVLMPVDQPEELYNKDMNKLIELLKEKYPHTKIYLQPILPVTEEAIKKEERYGDISKYNQILEKICKEQKIDMIHVNTILENKDSYFAEDGIHFKKEFYVSWLEFLEQELA